MRRHFRIRAALCVIVPALGLLALPALAEKPEWKEGGRDPHRAQESRQDWHPGKHERSERPQRHDDPPGRPPMVQHGQPPAPGVQVQISLGGYFAEQQRNAVFSYYADRRSQGKCPPGLAKKRNGCQPPGQVKKWQVGHPLPRDVVYAPVSRELSIRLGVPPEGHRFVRVASDILLIAIGTGMVIDAIEDLSR